MHCRSLTGWLAQREQFGTLRIGPRGERIAMEAECDDAVSPTMGTDWATAMLVPLALTAEGTPFWPYSVALTGHSLDTHWTLTGHSLNTHWTLTGHSLNTQARLAVHCRTLTVMKD